SSAEASTAWADWLHCGRARAALVSAMTRASRLACFIIAIQPRAESLLAARPMSCTACRLLPGPCDSREKSWESLVNSPGLRASRLIETRALILARLSGL